MDALLLPMLFLATATATGTVLWYLTEPDPMKRRLSEVVAGVPAAPGRRESVISEGPSQMARRARRFVPKSPEHMSHIQHMLASAGYHGEWPAILFSGVQIALPVRCLRHGRRHVWPRRAGAVWRHRRRTQLLRARVLVGAQDR